eukprot:CAMPEP_0183747140 /NCGR_PEP_ID=MMETSP0737-20130205/67114_1 /TAXON_ID=385413 /ORGANISM="Thalassiosira miniscula, Strain CCMP1093" /LENGTH=412 /DNA_ID=CAMNT_0025982849 /DNA_START=555 /DNA_END=1793 /DNA_ORIENTATION=-
MEVDMSAVKEAQAAMNASVTLKRSSSNLRRAEDAEEGINNRVVNSPVDSHISEQQRSSAAMATTLRRSRRVTHREAIGVGGAFDSDDDSRFSNQNDDDSAELGGGENVQEATSASRIDDTRARKRTRRADVNVTAGSQPTPSEDARSASGRQYSEEASIDQENGRMVQDGDAKNWIAAMSNKNLNVYRIRCYSKISVTTADKYGRKVSQWCVNNGYVICCSALAKLLPEDQRNDGEALKKRVLSVDHARLREECQMSPDFDYKEMGTYIRTLRQFIEMKKEDIVVLHTSGTNSARGPPQTLTFGVVQDDSLTVMHKNEAIQKHGFPWDFCDPGATTTFRIGFMARKIKWYRQGELRAVRGPTQANWLAECQTIWLGKVGAKTPEYLNHAISKMSSDEFLENTHAIDNEWTMD